MDLKMLQHQLAKLHTELADARQVDPQVRERLGDVMNDIRRLIDEPAAAAGGAATDAAAGAAVADRLEEIAVRFEAEHQSLAASIRRFVDLLGNVGL